MKAAGVTLFSTEHISAALRREQELARLKDRLRNTAVAETSKAIADDERLGAALLRTLIDRMDVFLIDDHYTVFRLVLPNQLVVDLDTWGSVTAELESDHDFEREEALAISA